MISPTAPPGQPRLVALIAPGDGPHLVAATGPASGRRRRPLADDLARCLAALDRDPEAFQRAAIQWHARWCREMPCLEIVDAHTALTALQALSGPAASDAARTLRYLCLRHDQPGAAAVLDAWVAQRA
jgi:hypothetical protein